MCEINERVSLKKRQSHAWESRTVLHQALRSDKAAQRHQPLDGNKAWQGYLSLQTQRQNGISGVNEVCVTHITQVFSNGRGAHYVTRGKKKKKSRKFRFHFKFLFVLFVLSFIHVKHLHSPPWRHHTYWICVLNRGRTVFLSPKMQKSSYVGNYEGRPGEVIYQRAQWSCKQSSCDSFCGSLWSIVVRLLSPPPQHLGHDKCKCHLWPGTRAAKRPVG